MRVLCEACGAETDQRWGHHLKLTANGDVGWTAKAWCLPCGAQVLDAIEAVESTAPVTPSTPMRELDDFNAQLRIAYGPGGITELGISHAADSALFRGGVLTIKQAASLSDEQIRAVPDVGPTRFEEIRRALLDFAARQAGGSADRFDVFLNDLLKS